MPKRKPTAAAAGETYDSDGGFVEDDDGGGGGLGGRRSKKAKNAAGVKKNGGVGAGAGAGAGGKGIDKNGAKSGGQVGRDGEVFWELTSKRRVGITEFKGKQMVNIREYYEKDGETLPGKKGISLPIEQFNALIKVLPHIETALAEKGQQIERPDYGGAGASAAVDKDDDDEDEDEEDEEVETKKKKNFEETSDEE